ATAVGGEARCGIPPGSPRSGDVSFAPGDGARTPGTASVARGASLARNGFSSPGRSMGAVAVGLAARNESWDARGPVARTTRVPRRDSLQNDGKNRMLGSPVTGGAEKSGRTKRTLAMATAAMVVVPTPTTRTDAGRDAGRDNVPSLARKSLRT